MNKIQSLIESAEQLYGKLPQSIYLTDVNHEVIWMNEHLLTQFSSDTSQWKKINPSQSDFSDTAVVERRNGSFVAVRRQFIPIPINERDGNPVHHRHSQLLGFTVLVKTIKSLTSNDSSKKEEEKYKIVAENTTDVIVLVDHSGLVQYTSPSICEMTGYTAEEYEGMDAFDVLHPEDRESVRNEFLRVLQTKTHVNVEYRIAHKQGFTVFAETEVKPVLDDEGKVVYVVATVRDVTEQKNTEQLLESILNSVKVVVYSTDKEFTSYRYLSDSIERIAGVSRAELIHNPIRLHDQMHPDDSAMLMNEARQLLDQGIAVSREIRYIHIENEIKWGRLMIHPITNARGEVERLDGIILDITELKQSELALEESEQRYKSLFENNLDGVFSIDLNLNLVSANHSFEKITGIKSESLSNRCFTGLIFDEDHPSVYQILHEVMNNLESRDIECRMSRSPAEKKVVHITFVPILLTGKLNGVHGIVKDITERKKEEQKLVESEERYKFLQHRINRFANDLTDVIKVADLENRLLEEIGDVLSVEKVSIEEVERDSIASIKKETSKWILITEKEQLVYLRIELSKPLLDMEEEWLETAVHYVTILYDNLQFIEDLMERMENLVNSNETPKWMLRLLFRLSEKERASLSSDLHDSVLQDLIIWYRKLELLRTTTVLAEEVEQELKQVEEGVLDAIHQIRITCNELRPPFLLKVGLDESLNGLFAYARMFTNYEINFEADSLDYSLSEDQTLGIYRIVQELLNNASKHSKATKVAMKLFGDKDHVYFSYSDNGVGMDLTAYQESYQHMGIAGMENRVLSLDGKVNIQSAPGQGFHVSIAIPVIVKEKG